MCGESTQYVPPVPWLGKRDWVRRIILSRSGVKGAKKLGN